MNTKISMLELENQLNEFLKNVENNSSVYLGMCFFIKK